MTLIYNIYFVLYRYGEILFDFMVITAVLSMAGVHRGLALSALINKNCIIK